MCVVLLEGLGAEGAGEEEEEGEVEVLEEPLAVSEVDPGDVSVAAVAAVGLAVAIGPGVAGSAVGLVSSLQCNRKNFCDCEWRSSS